MEGTLYTYPESFRANKALIAAKYSGAKINVPEFTMGVTNATPEFLKKFPLGKVPAFESKSGDCVFESNAIAYYLSNETLRGSNPLDVASVQQWISFGDSELISATANWVYPCLGVSQFNKQTTERAKTDVRRTLEVLESTLASKTFLVGERVTLADVSLVCNLLSLYTTVLDAEFRKPFVNVNRWFETVVNQPQVKAVLGDVKVCEKMAQFDTKKFNELHGKSDAKKEKKPKAEVKKVEKKPKEPEVEEDDTPRDPPSKDPFAAMPKGTFVMDDWKKVYSNEDTAKVAIPYFFENFDPTCYSVWYGEYKFPEELKMAFMSCNLITGMFQRLDRLRKHGFSSVIVFGENNNGTISGIWCWKGQDLAFDLSEDLKVDYGSYKWKKLDYESKDTRKMIEEYFLWEGKFDGKKFNQGKIFK